MYNYFMLCGKINKINEEDKTIEIIDVSPFKNSNGEYEKQIITVNVDNFLFETLKDMDLNIIYGIKGRIKADGKWNILICERFITRNDNE